jgi:outer membrane protein
MGKTNFNSRMRKRIMIVTGIILIGNFLSAQEGWTLQDCLDYAVEHNLTVKRQEVTSEQYRYDLTEQKLRMLPNLSFESAASINYGRSVSPEDNIITFDPNLSNSYTLSSGVTIFNGFAQYNRVSATKLLNLMGQELVERQKNLLSLDIVNAYYSLLMARGLAETAQAQLEVTMKQLRRTELMVETGKEPKTTWYELQSQASSDNLLLTQAKNNALIALQDLVTLLQLEPGTDFNIANGDTIMIEVEREFEPDSLYNAAKEVLPMIHALELKTRSMEKQLSSYKGLLTPALSIYGGFRTQYFNALNSDVEPPSFNTQLKDNSNPYFGIHIGIPIFNRWSNMRNVKRAMLNLEDSNLELEQEYNNLYQEVTKACLELTASQDEYLAARDNLEFSRIAYDAVEKKFTTGIANATEFAEARRQFFSAEVTLLRAQLQYNVRMITIRFYQTGEWKG